LPDGIVAEKTRTWVNFSSRSIDLFIFIGMRKCRTAMKI
jgi:hypothetical protein